LSTVVTQTLVVVAGPHPRNLRGGPDDACLPALSRTFKSTCKSTRKSRRRAPRLSMGGQPPAGDIIAMEPGLDAYADPMERARLDRQRQSPRRLAHLFWTLARPYWQYAPGAKLDLGWVVFLGLLQSAIAVLFSYVSRDFWTALQKKDVAKFWRQILLFSGLLCAALPIIVWYSYSKDRLSLRWRQWHTRKLLGEYFSERNYYAIDQHSNVDNVDQRISEDTASFTATSLSLFMTIFMSTIDLVNFSIILMTIYPRLFIVLIAYSSMGTLITMLLGRRLISLNFVQLQREADFRFSIIRVRENAESIAFYNGEARERQEIERRFGSAVDNLIDLITWSRNLSFFTTTYSYMIQILPLSIIAPLYFKGSIELGVVSQSQQAFRHILDDLSLIISQFESLSAFSAGIDRLGELEEFLYERYRENAKIRAAAKSSALTFDGSDGRKMMDDLGWGGDEDYGDSGDGAAGFDDGAAAARFVRSTMYTDAEAAEYVSDQELLSAEGGSLPVRIATIVERGHDATLPAIVVKDLTLMTPDRQHRVLFEDLSLHLEQGKRMLIVGPSGTGKSSFLRALAGLWSSGRGSISRPCFKKMFFLPQRPYCTLGSLREQLVYPMRVSDTKKTDEDLHEALDRVDLSQLPARMGGLDAVRSWSTVLSLGEQQRVAFARLLIGQPPLAILDESSSALDLESERRLYAELRRVGISFVSVGHRPSLLQYHDVLLKLAPGHGCSVMDINPDMYARDAQIPIA
jgi:vitamin B12/bleomycin/antimicrobial peptide transport system ATP-binding/permease protein